MIFSGSHVWMWELDLMKAERRWIDAFECLSRCCHPTISSSVVTFSSCTQSFPASGSFQMSQLFASGGQSIGVSASTSVLPMNTQDWSPLGWTGWISLTQGSNPGFPHCRQTLPLSHQGSYYLLWRHFFKCSYSNNIAIEILLCLNCSFMSDSLCPRGL